MFKKVFVTKNMCVLFFQDIDKFNKTSINRLIENSKPDPEVLQKSDYLFHWLQDVFKVFKRFNFIVLFTVGLFYFCESFFQNQNRRSKYSLLLQL